MKKTFLIAAASLFVIGQALAQGQTPPPSGQKSGQPNTQQTTQQKAQPNSQQKAGQQQSQKQSTKSTKSAGSSGKKRHAMSHHRGGHRMAHRAHHQRMAGGPQQGQQMQQGFGFGGQRQPTKLTCKKGQKPDGITCM